MKNKIIFIAVIIVILLCFATLSAVFIQKTSDDGPEEISFYWDDVEYTVEEGTTFGEFVRSTDLQYEGKPYEICPDTGYITYTAHKCSLYMSVDPEGKIKAGEHYGAGDIKTFTYGDIEYDFHNGATWGSYIGIMNYDHDLIDFVDCSIYNNEIRLDDGKNFWVCYPFSSGDVSGKLVRAYDLIIADHVYMTCKA